VVDLAVIGVTSIAPLLLNEFIKTDKKSTHDP
jgi:hypothetical protein